MAHITDIIVGFEDLDAGEQLPRHRHVCAYAALILAGSYEESGQGGRIRAEAGDVVVHGHYAAHLDQIGGQGARTLNLHLPDTTCEGLVQITDPDRVLRLAETDQHAATMELADQLDRATLRPAAYRDDWPDMLARELLADCELNITRWGDRQALAPATISRGFLRAYGISPRAFRAEARARHAWQQIVRGQDGLAAIAAGLGFADQAHMTRSVRALTGATPGRWRRSSQFKTAP